MFRFLSAALIALALSGPTIGGGAAAAALVSPLRTAVAGAAAPHPMLAAFYRGRGFAPIWIGADAAPRRAALLDALGRAGDHGLPVARYDAAGLRDAFRDARDPAALGSLEVETTRLLLRFAREASGGVLAPASVDPTIRVEVPVRDAAADLTSFADGDPVAFLRGLWPDAPGYRRLLREKLRLERAVRTGGWGPDLADGTLRPGDAGRAVVALRDRLVRMGYLRRSTVATFDPALEAAVRAFQTDHGLTADGEAGAATLRALAASPEDRLGQVLVGLERQRWTSAAREPRHVLVNVAEQRAYVVDDGRVTFETVVVVGSDAPDRRTSEFSDTMTHIVVNPTWNVPRSIAVNEYLPALRKGGARHLQVIGPHGRVDPARVDFSRYTASTFPFRLAQPPGPQNALGRVKFMFPNRWNIYLHDTPSRDLFARDLRTFSHGCVRVGRPLELAYHLLAPQTSTPEADFDAILATGAERRLDLERAIGVHIVYWSAWVTPDGRAHYRGDPYGRDAAVLRALREAGVAPASGGS